MPEWVRLARATVALVSASGSMARRQKSPRSQCGSFCGDGGGGERACVTWVCDKHSISEMHAEERSKDPPKQRKLGWGTRRLISAVAAETLRSPVSLMMGGKSLAHCLPLFQFLARGPDRPLGHALPAVEWVAPTNRLRSSRRHSIIWFNRSHPRHQLLQRPILLAHDMMVEQVRDDVFDAHLARQQKTPALAWARHRRQDPTAPDALGAEGTPV